MSTRSLPRRASQATGGKDYHRRARPRSGVLCDSERAGRIRARNPRHARAAWRGIGSGYNKFAAEAFLDEVAHGHGQGSARAAARADQGPPARQRRDQGRGRNVRLRQEAPGRGMGIAFSRLSWHVTPRASRKSRSISKTGKIKVQNYWVAVDPGLVDPAGSRPRSARERGGLRFERRADRGIDGQGRRVAGHELRQTIRSCA